jgi:hypothetical protein
MHRYNGSYVPCPTVLDCRQPAFARKIALLASVWRKQTGQVKKADYCVVPDGLRRPSRQM